MNTLLLSGHFQSDGDIMPTLAFGGQLAIQCIEILLEQSLVILVVRVYHSIFPTRDYIEHNL